MGQSGSALYIRQSSLSPVLVTAMFLVVFGMVAAAYSCQAFPIFPNQGLFRQSRQSFNFVDAVPEIESARLEFMEELDRAMTSLVTDVTGQAVEDTEEVAEAKDAFMEVFNNALNGFITEVFLEDTPDVKAAKQEFFKEFEAATNGLIKTVENFYIEDTAEVRDAKAAFNQAFEDAKAGRVGAQYIPYTPEVQEARDQFFRFFELVVNGMLYKLAPQPVVNYYIPDTPEVNNAKKEFRDLYKSALKGDFDAALTLVALEDAISNNENNPERAAEEFLQTATTLQEMIRILEADGSLDLQTYTVSDNNDDSEDDSEAGNEEEEDAVNEIAEVFSEADEDFSSLDDEEEGTTELPETEDDDDYEYDEYK